MSLLFLQRSSHVVWGVARSLLGILVGMVELVLKLSTVDDVFLFDVPFCSCGEKCRFFSEQTSGWSFLWEFWPHRVSWHSHGKFTIQNRFARIRQKRWGNFCWQNQKCLSTQGKGSQRTRKHKRPSSSWWSIQIDTHTHTHTDLQLPLCPETQTLKGWTTMMRPSQEWQDASICDATWVHLRTRSNTLKVAVVFRVDQFNCVLCICVSKRWSWDKDCFLAFSPTNVSQLFQNTNFLSVSWWLFPVLNDKTENPLEGIFLVTAGHF